MQIARFKRLPVVAASALALTAGLVVAPAAQAASADLASQCTVAAAKAPGLKTNSNPVANIGMDAPGSAYVNAPTLVTLAPFNISMDIATGANQLKATAAQAELKFQVEGNAELVAETPGVTLENGTLTISTPLSAVVTPTTATKGTVDLALVTPVAFSLKSSEVGDIVISPASAYLSGTTESKYLAIDTPLQYNCSTNDAPYLAKISVKEEPIIPLPGGDAEGSSGSSEGSSAGSSEGSSENFDFVQWFLGLFRF